MVPAWLPHLSGTYMKVRGHHLAVRKQTPMRMDIHIQKCQHHKNTKIKGDLRNSDVMYDVRMDSELGRKGAQDFSETEDDI